MGGLPFTPLVIIGAGRSGTNVLRDVLTGLPGFASWKCDEINPIWRHGNINWPDDELPVEAARPEVKHFIRQQFLKVWRQNGQPEFVVEKTCANALRVGFVAAVLPEARFVHIIRHGADVAASAEKRWRGELEMPGLPYFWAKIRYAPKGDLPRYGLSFVKNRLALRGRMRRFSSWGPRFKGMDELAGTDLPRLTAMQWAASVVRADAAFANMAKDRVIELRYEDFIAAPEAELSRILAFLGQVPDPAQIARASLIVRRGARPPSPVPAGLAPVIAPVLKAHGYGE